MNWSALLCNYLWNDKLVDYYFNSMIGHQAVGDSQHVYRHLILFGIADVILIRYYEYGSME